LASRGFKPKTHTGLRELFGKEIVLKGLAEKKYGRYLTEAFSVRQAGTYDIYANFGEEGVKGIVDKAERFIQKMKEIIGRTS